MKTCVKSRAQTEGNTLTFMLGTHHQVTVSDLGKCPLCFKKFPLDAIDNHVNYCLIESERSVDPFSIVPNFEEEDKRRRKQQEEENERYFSHTHFTHPNQPIIPNACRRRTKQTRSYSNR